MSEKKEANWYSFHFGSAIAESSEFQPESFYGKTFEDCYVFFGDLCSFTTFLKASEDLGQVDTILTGFYSRTRKAIHRYHGMLHQIVGDGIVAIWGVHYRRDDMLVDILHFINDFKEIAESTSEEWHSIIPIRVSPTGIRAGLTRGKILVARRSDEYPGLSLIGNPLNLASRLQGAASPNQLMVSERVYGDLQRLNIHSDLKPYTNPDTGNVLHVKNYGAISPWCLAL